MPKKIRKLTDGQVRKIRAAVERGAKLPIQKRRQKGLSYNALAEKYGCTRAMIGFIVNRRAYKDVE